MSANNDYSDGDMARPAGPRSERVSSRLETTLLDRVDETVTQQRLKNRSELIRQAVAQYLETSGHGGERTVRVRLTVEQLDFINQVVELEASEDMGEFIRSAVDLRIGSMTRNARERNDYLAYLRENRHLRQRSGLVP